MSILNVNFFLNVRIFKKSGHSNSGVQPTLFFLMSDEEKKKVLLHILQEITQLHLPWLQDEWSKSQIVMPENAPAVKKNAVAGYGAESHSANRPCRRAKKQPQIMEKTGATLIHPYDNFNVICGQGTAAWNS